MRGNDEISIKNFINQSTMPRTIFKSNAQNFIGHKVSIFCKHCKKRMMSVIDDSGSICCPTCGSLPKGKNVTLAMSERRKLINTLFAKNSDLDNYYMDLMQQFCKVIDDMSSGKLSKSGVKRFYDYLRNEFSVLDDCTLYYLKSPDCPDPLVFSDSELDRMNYREDRKVNCVHYDNFKSQADDEGLSLYDLVDAMANEYRDENFRQYYDPKFDIKEFMEPLKDLTQRNIVYLLYAGYNKKEIESLLHLTETQLRTIIKHIAKHLKTPLTEDHRVKECSCCHEVKIASDFGRDSRNKTDGLQSRCKTCDARRKKITGKSTKCRLIWSIVLEGCSYSDTTNSTWYDSGKHSLIQLYQ